MVAPTMSYEAPAVEVLGQVSDLTGSGASWYVGDVQANGCVKRKCIYVHFPEADRGWWAICEDNYNELKVSSCST
mgnify:CR=1 FL=1